MKLKSTYLVKPESTVNLRKLPTSDSGGYQSAESAAPVLVKHRSQLASLQDVFYAAGKKALLIVLQGMDTAGKDGTISHIFTGVNPQGCDVSTFKVPTPVESRHDFLWRVHSQVPPRGMIGIFNRSHYEDVLSPRVHKLITAKEARARLEDINEFEDMLVDNDVVILKFFLHISRDEQARRLQDRLDDPFKHWKLSEADFHERKFWDRYTAAYEEIFARTSHKHAPWFIVPADHKWFRNIAVSEVVVQCMESLKLKYPKPTVDPAQIKL